MISHGPGGSYEPSMHASANATSTRLSRSLAIVAFTLLLAPLGCVEQQTHPPVVRPPTLNEALSPRTSQGFDDALRALAHADRTQTWDESTCLKVANGFAKTAAQLDADATTMAQHLQNKGSALPPKERSKLLKQLDNKRKGSLSAQYNEGLTLQRCGLHERAQATLKSIVERNPKFSPAQTELARRSALTGNPDKLRASVAALERSVRAAAFSDADALVLLATMQTQLHRQAAESKENWLDSARANLQRALAIKDDHLAAYNQLALNYLERAQVNQLANGRADLATLEMAELVCAQALQRQPNFAPVHNTIGVIAAKRGDLSLAARSFSKARSLAPKLFEAQMNYAAVNLQYRGFSNARAAYEQALKQRPKSYDATIGLALAFRGMASGNEKALLTKARELLKRARSIDDKRPESYLNEAILILEFDARFLPKQEADAAYAKARGLLLTFLERSKKHPRFAAARKRAQGRLEDIERLIEFRRREGPAIQ